MSDPALTATSMPDVLRIRADQNPHSLAFCFLIDGQEEGPRVTYADLDRQARTVAAALQNGAEPGDRVMLIYAPGLEFISAFFGCQYAGMVPVPVYPPRLGQLAQSAQTLQSLAADCQPHMVLSDSPVASFLAGGLEHLPALAGVPHLVTTSLDESLCRRWREPAFEANSIALLQYTSGSTAAPKGVMVSHRNLMVNQRTMHAALEHCGRGVGVCWLPTYHDMGLIGCVLETVYMNYVSYMMSPITLLHWPIRWLQAISRYRADTSGGPNFAFDFCVHRIAPEEKAGLDLSSWSIAAIGSEPISPKTIEAFTAAFESYGFRPETFCPCYGLAEATLLVAAGTKAALPNIRCMSAVALEQGLAVAADPKDPDSRRLVSCGHPWMDQEVQIVDPELCVRSENGQIGEIWVKGAAVADGYWRRPEETERTFRARLRDTGDGPYLRTGDLGFLQDGQLFVTGRLKDLLIVHGRNHYPHDIEETVQSVHPGLRRGCGAVFEISHEGAPLLVVVQEVERNCRTLDPQRVIGDVRQAVAERHELHLHDLRLLEYGSIPKTTSGKVRRHACQLAYKSDKLHIWRGSRKQQ